MRKNQNPHSDDLEELLWRAEAVLQDPEPEYYDEPEEEYADEFYDDAYPPENYVQDDTREPPAVYQDYMPPQPQYEHNQDGYPAAAEYWEEEASCTASVKKQRKHRRNRGCGCGCFTTLLFLAAIIAVAVFTLIRPPRTEKPIGDWKLDTSTILICGTDEDGTRTDTMMLLYLSGSERQVSLLSLPRDTYTITSAGKPAKLNSAFGRNGTGEEGMEALLDYVRDIIGYRPDGYILVDFTLVPQIVDIMGGVDVEVPMDMEVSGVALEEGYQHLSGREVMTLLRFRKGYATADLGRVEVQRTVLKACMEQWLSFEHISNAFEAIDLLESGSISSLNTGNYLWVAKTLLLGLGDFQNDTLPGYAQYRNDVSYYILDKSEVADLIDSDYNPYTVTITEDDLNIAE